MDKQRDYNNYDYLSVSLKLGVKRDLRKFYQLLGWELLDERADNRFVDVLHCTYRRAHHVKNKDRLQYLQVRCETEINRMAKATQNRNVKSALACVTGILLAAFLLCGSMMTLFLAVAPLRWALAAFLFAVCVGVCIATPFLVRKVKKQEEEGYKKQMTEGVNTLQEIHNQIILCTGGAYEKA